MCLPVKAPVLFFFPAPPRLPFLYKARPDTWTGPSNCLCSQALSAIDTEIDAKCHYTLPLGGTEKAFSNRGGICRERDLAGPRMPIAGSAYWTARARQGLPAEAHRIASEAPVLVHRYAETCRAQGTQQRSVQKLWVPLGPFQNRYGVGGEVSITGPGRRPGEGGQDSGPMGPPIAVRICPIA